MVAEDNNNAMRSVSKYWACTLHNYTPMDEEHLKMLENDGFIEFVLYGKELTSSDGPHLQTMIITTNRVRGKTLKNKLLNKKWWLSVMKGTIKQNVAYCSKDKEVTAHGTQPPEKEPGKRTDIHSCRS